MLVVECTVSANGKSSGLLGGVDDTHGPGIVAECVNLGEILSVKSIDGGAPDVELLADRCCWSPKPGKGGALSNGLANGLSG